MFDFSELDATVADTFGQSVTLRRSGQEDVTITAALSDQVAEGASDILRDAFVAAGPTISEGDQVIVGEATYRAGPVVVETTGAMRFRLFRAY